jgi:hypothetical protein
MIIVGVLLVTGDGIITPGFSKIKFPCRFWFCQMFRVHALPAESIFLLFSSLTFVLADVTLPLK